MLGVGLVFLFLKVLVLWHFAWFRCFVGTIVDLEAQGLFHIRLLSDHLQPAWRLRNALTHAPLRPLTTRALVWSGASKSLSNVPRFFFVDGPFSFAISQRVLWVSSNIICPSHICYLIPLPYFLIPDCGNVTYPIGESTVYQECQRPCNGNAGEYCGDSARMLVYTSLPWSLPFPWFIYDSDPNVQLFELMTLDRHLFSVDIRSGIGSSVQN